MNGERVTAYYGVRKGRRVYLHMMAVNGRWYRRLVGIKRPV